MQYRYWCYGSKELNDAISHIIADSSIDTTQQSHVMFACDTRLVFILAFCSCDPTAHMITFICSHYHKPSGEHLSNILEQALLAMHSSYDNLHRHVVYDLRGSYHVAITTGILTTTQLHYMLWLKNAEDPPSNVDDYYNKTSTAFTKLLPEVSSRQATPHTNAMY